MTDALRIDSGQDLGRSRRALDLVLGSVAMLPILGAGADVWIAPAGLAFTVSLVTIWTGVLLAFFAGVRRGLTFSELGGARPLELLTMLWLFALGLGAVVFQSVSLSMIGLASVALLDARASWLREAPDYFLWFRPAQMTVALLSLLAVLVRQHAA
jgi:hypothetical protein